MKRWTVALSILIYTAWYTATHDLWWVVVLWICFVVVTKLWWWFIQQKRWSWSDSFWSIKLIKIVVISWLCAVWSVWSVRWYDLSMEEKIHTSTSYMSTGVIINQPKPWQYILHDAQWKTMVVQTPQEFGLGTIVGVSWKVSQKAWTTHKTLSTLTKFDYPTWLWMKWYGWVVKIQRIWVETWDISSYNSHLLTLKQRIVDRINTLFGRTDNAWLVRGILIWSRAWLSDETYQSFIASWLVHLIAVSGSNMVYTALVLTWLLWRLPYYIRLLCVWGWVIVYALVCGWDSSVVRAVIMSSMWIMALVAGRNKSIQYILPIVMITMLAFNPYQLVYDLGFGLSFGAVVGLTITTQWRRRVVDHFDIMDIKQALIRWMILHPLGSIIIPCIGATLWVLPLLMVMTWQYNITWLAINAVLQPCIPFVTLWWGVAIISNDFGMIGRRIQLVENWLVGSIIWLSNWTVSHGLILLVDRYGSIIVSLSCMLILRWLHYQTKRFNTYTKK